jgi:hypothetical protein
MSILARSAVLLAVALACLMASAQEERSYSEGEVVQVSYIRTQPGMFDAYLEYLASTYQELLEEQKQGGLVTEYHVYSAQPRTSDEPDLILTVHYKNWAAFDGLGERIETLLAKKFGSRERSNAAAVDREKLRRTLGGETLQELLLK